eukprot:751244-Ditylum_brightwellii.AAC.1
MDGNNNFQPNNNPGLGAGLWAEYNRTLGPRGSNGLEKFFTVLERELLYKAVFAPKQEETKKDTESNEFSMSYKNP